MANRFVKLTGPPTDVGPYIKLVPSTTPTAGDEMDWAQDFRERIRLGPRPREGGYRSRSRRADPSPTGTPPPRTRSGER